jgi:hypothetical protein
MLRPPILLALSLLLAAPIAVADAELVPSRTYEARYTFEAGGGIGSAIAYARDGQLRFDIEDFGGVRLLRVDGGYVLEAATADLETFLFGLDELLEDPLLYDQLVYYFIFMLPPDAGLHPCVQTEPADGVLTGDFTAWSCEIVGSTEWLGRSVTIWEYEHIWGREGVFAVFNDPPVIAWIDDELGVPARIVIDDDGGSLVIELVSFDEVEPDAALFAFGD